MICQYHLGQREQNQGNRVCILMSCISICVICTDFSGRESGLGWLFQLNLYHFAPCGWGRQASPRNPGASSSPQEVEMEIVSHFIHWSLRAEGVENCLWPDYSSGKALEQTGYR